MESAKVRTANSVPAPVNGACTSRSQLQIPKSLSRIDCMLLCAELESNVFAEGVSASMGNKSKGTATLNRRGGSASDGWQPLIWAAKDNNLAVATMLLDKGHDVNHKESMQDKGLSGYWASALGGTEGAGANGRAAPVARRQSTCDGQAQQHGEDAR